MSRDVRICLVAIVGVFVLLIFPSDSRARATEFDIYESSLNRMLNEIGTISGKGGTYTLYYYHPCFPDFWNRCKSVFASGPVYWQLYKNSFEISTSGVKVKGKVRFDWCGWTYVVDYTGSATLNYNSANMTIRLSVSSITVPIRFFGITFTHKTFNLPYSMSLPISGFKLPVGQSDGSTGYIRVYPAGVAISTHYNLIRVKLDPRFQWLE